MSKQKTPENAPEQWDPSKCKYAHKLVDEHFKNIEEKMDQNKIDLKEDNEEIKELIKDVKQETNEEIKGTSGETAYAIEEVKEEIKEEIKEESINLKDKIKTTEESLMNKIEIFDKTLRGNGNNSNIGILEKLRSIEGKIEGNKNTIKKWKRIFFFILIMIMGARVFGIGINEIKNLIFGKPEIKIEKIENDANPIIENHIIRGK